MSDTPPRLNSELVADFGRRLFGAVWKARMADFTGVGEKTIGRIGAAAERGEEYPPARGVLAALDERLAPIARELEEYRRPTD